MTLEWLPFAFGLLFFLVADVLDTVWIHSVESEYKGLPLGGTSPELLTRGFRWAVDVAQAAPSALLTLVGIAALIPHAPLAFGLVLAGAAVVVVWQVHTIARKARLTSYESDLKKLRIGKLTLRRSRLQISVALLNVAGLLVAGAIAVMHAVEPAKAENPKPLNAPVSTPHPNPSRT